MSVYGGEDTYRIVAADGGGVRVLMPGGFATTGIEECYPSGRAAAAAIAHAIRDGMPALAMLDETTSVPPDQPSTSSMTGQRPFAGRYDDCPRSRIACSTATPSVANCSRPL
jgi:hypothetical protein